MRVEDLVPVSRIASWGFRRMDSTISEVPRPFTSHDCTRPNLGRWWSGGILEAEEVTR